MNEVIYGDIFFIINFSMDFMALYITGRILHLKMQTLPVIMSAGLGALYSVVILFVHGNAVIEFMISLCTAALMCYIVFGESSKIEYIRSVLLFFAVNLIIGGGITALYNAFNRLRASQKIYINGDINTLYSNVSPYWLALFALISAAAALLSGIVFRRKSVEGTANITICHGGNETQFEALSDSGNLLCEPMGGKPVIIVDMDTAASVIPNDIITVLEHRDTESLDSLSLELIRRIRFIPLTTVGHEGMIIGFIPDSIKVNGTEVDACIAIDASGEKRSILPAVLMR